MSNTTVTLSEVVEQIAKKADKPLSVVKAVLVAEQEVVGQSLKKGHDVPAINGAVKLSVGQRAARSGRNPQTGETIQIPAKKVVKVKVGKKLQDTVD